MQPPVVGSSVRRVADFHLLGHRALAECNDLEFLGLVFRWSFIFFAFYIEDEVRGFLSLRCRVNHQLAVLFQSREPMLYVAGGFAIGKT